MITSYEQALLDSRTELQVVQDRMRVLQSGIKSLEALVGTGSMPSKARSGMKLPERILQAKAAEPSRRWGVVELEEVLDADGLGGPFKRSNLKTTLLRLVKDGRIVDGTDNRYTAATTE